MKTLMLNLINKSNNLTGSLKIKKGVISVFSIILFSASATFFIQANWLQMKAVVAQVFIAQAWKDTVHNPTKSLSTQYKPWHWADFWPVAKLQWGDNKPVYVLSGSNGQSLAFGPGHLVESAEPGSRGQVIIAGHKDSHFAFLRYVKIGDTLLLEDKLGFTRRYIIEAKNIVDSRSNTLQLNTKDELVLITCYPFNNISFNGPLRLVITATPTEHHNT